MCLCFVLDKCDDLSDQTDGTVTLSTDNVTTTAVFTCTAGYSLSGSSVVECRPDGSWEFMQPTCGMFAVILFWV